MIIKSKEYGKFYTSRRRHDEDYWRAIWSRSGGNCRKAASDAGVSLRSAIQHLERLGIQARKNAKPTLTPNQLAERLAKCGVSIDTPEALDQHQRIAAEIWLASLDSGSTTLYNLVIPGFLLQHRAPCNE